MKEAAAGETSLAARAAHPMRGGVTAGLIKKIEDVIRTIEYYAPDLKVSGKPAVAARKSASDPFEPAMIFRP